MRLLVVYKNACVIGVYLYFGCAYYLAAEPML